MDRSLQHAFDPEELMAYLDGELESRRASALASHLEACGECQRATKDFRRLSSHLLNFEVEPLPPSMSDAMVKAFENRGERKPTQPATWNRFDLWNWPLAKRAKPKWLLGAASLAILAFLLFIATPNLLRVKPGVLDLAATRSRTMESAPAASGARPAFPATSYQDLMQRRERAAITEDLENKPEAYLPSPPPPSVESEDSDGTQAQLTAPQVSGPMIEQTVSLHIVPVNYDDASAAIEKLATARGGYVGSLTATAQSGAARDVSVELRIPARQADSFVADIRKLGKVVEETRASEEVTAEYVDLQARMKAAKAAEQRLVELLGTRTGKLSDVLEVERELARVRSEIESMQGQSNVMLHQVSYATVKVELSEEYHEKLQSHSASTWTKIRNAGIDGFNNLEQAIVAVLVFFLDFGLLIVFWLALLLVPLWLIWRKMRRRA